MAFSKKRSRGRDQAPSSAAGYTPAGSSTPYSRNNAQYAGVIAAARKQRTRKVRRGIIIAVVALLAVAGTAAALYVNNLNSLLSGNLSSDEQNKIDNALADTSFDEPFYVLLIGSDARTGDTSLGQRSDTNILVRVDIPNSTITMISIPRDTAINYGSYGTVKFNAAYAYDGTVGTINAANELCGVQISHYATIGFDGLTDLVNSVGGVDVNVPERIDDPDAGDVVIEAGEQHLDGEAALVFARSRAYTDGDYTRVANQRTLIQAIADKALKENAVDLSNTVTSAAKCVTTDLSAQDLVTLALKIQNVSDLKIYSATLPSTTGTIDGVSYVFADVPGIQVLMDAVNAGKDPSSDEVKKAIEAADENGSSASSSSGVGENAVDASGSSSADSAGSYGYGSYGSTGSYSNGSGYDYGYGSAGSGYGSGYSSAGATSSGTSGYGSGSSGAGQDDAGDTDTGIGPATSSNVQGGRYGAIDDR